MCVCLSVCPPSRLVITSGVVLDDMDSMWLVKQLLQIFYGSYSQKAHQLLLLVAKVSLTLTVRTLILTLSLKSHALRSSSKIFPNSISSKKRHYLKRWETEFEWLEYNEDLQGVFFKYCKSGHRQETKYEERGLLWKYFHYSPNEPNVLEKSNEYLICQSLR